MNKPRILIVEDEIIVALDLQARLQTMGYEVVGAVSTGEQAVAKSVELQPDVVLMDIVLRGGMDGIEAARRIREVTSLPVIFLTASTDEKTLQRAKITGPFGYVLKPFEDRELYGHIEIARYKHGLEERLRKSEERYALAARGANDGLWDWDLRTGRAFFSMRWKAMLGLSEEQFGDDPEEWLALVHPADRDRVRDQLERHLKGLSPHFESEYRILHAGGDYRWMLTRGLAMTDRQGTPVRIAGSQSDITDRKVHDPLTGLPNLTLYTDRLERALERARRSQDSTFAVLAIGIRNFQQVKDSFGFAAAAELVVELSRRFEGCLKPCDTLAFAGGGDFLLLLEEIPDITEASRVALRLQQKLSGVFEIDRQRVWVATGIGIASGGPDRTAAEDLVLQAQTAMHRSCKTTGQQCEIFDDQMRAVALGRLETEAALRRAVEESSFCLHYQPIVSLKTGHACGLEALVRWERDGHLVYPADFIPIAEDTGLIIPLERWVMQTACAQMRAWHDQGLFRKPGLISVNISPQHCAYKDLTVELKEILETTGLDPGCVQLEITESALVEDSEHVLAILDQIRHLRIRLHMDDFGTGYSSLSYLHRFPISALKVDRSFVEKMTVSSETRKIVESITALGRSLRLDVTAEGVEDSSQLRLLKLLGCRFGQGYFFSPPVPAEDIPAVVAGEAWRSDVLYPLKAVARG